jgi:hypothetical protein
MARDRRHHIDRKLVIYSNRVALIVGEYVAIGGEIARRSIRKP